MKSVMTVEFYIRIYLLHYYSTIQMVTDSIPKFATNLKIERCNSILAASHCM